MKCAAVLTNFIRTGIKVKNIRILFILWGVGAFFGFYSCRDYDDYFVKDTPPKALILYSVGYNNLSYNLKKNIEELKQGYIPYNFNSKDDDLILIVSKSSLAPNDYTNPSPIQLIRLYKDIKTQEVIADTVKRWDNEEMINGNTVKNIFEYIKSNYPAASYGLIFSSHGTGWLPSGYFENHKSFEKNGIIEALSVLREKKSYNFFSQEQDYYYYPKKLDTPVLVKSFGSEYILRNNKVLSKSINIEHLADALPFSFDYIIFDACFMGGIEVAYALKDKCKQIIFSPTEIIADGFDYKNLSQHLLRPEFPNTAEVCEDFFNKYNSFSGNRRSATITLVNCSKLDHLAQISKNIFNKYRSQIKALSAEQIQAYSGGEKLWFYDFYDIFTQADIEVNDLENITDAINQCIEYKNHTDAFYSSTLNGTIKINSFSGLSTYLPQKGSSLLNKFYKELSWNKATCFVD